MGLKAYNVIFFLSFFIHFSPSLSILSTAFLSSPPPPPISSLEKEGKRAIQGNNFWYMNEINNLTL